MKNNRICALLDIEVPVIQAGMIWCSGWELASAVSNAGGLGVIGSGSMYPDNLRHHIRKCREHTNRPFAVNIPLFYPQIEEHCSILLEEKVPVVISSAGNPKTWTPRFREAGMTVIHVVSSSLFARKAEDAGVHAVVAEGFEAGGHNGKEETTTLCLVPAVVHAVQIPVVAAGGIYSGRTMLAAMALGAEGVQVGSRFVASVESSAHPSFKKKITDAKEGDTHLTLKELTPVRLLKNPFFDRLMEAYGKGATREELQAILGRARAKKGMFEGDMSEGELEIGQVSANFHHILPAADILSEILTEYRQALGELQGGPFHF